MVGNLLKNKRGWLRILEATIAVLIVTGVMVLVYSRQVDRESGFDNYIGNLEEKILLDISSDKVLRGYALDNINVASLEDLSNYVGTQIPPNFDYILKSCSFTGDCKLEGTELDGTKGKDVFTKSLIISANENIYNPRELRLFVWEKQS